MVDNPVGGRCKAAKITSKRLYLNESISRRHNGLLEGVDSVDSPAIMGACLGRRMGLEAA
jgi:hypothetical protein